MRRALPLLVLLWLSPAHAAEPLIADLTSHFVAITTGFTGANVVLFGATDGPGDVIVVVRGPNRDAVVRRKSRVAGIWINTRQMTFTGVPSYYAVYSTRPLDEIMPPAMRALHDIGLANLPLAVAQKGRSPQEIADFRAALIRERRQGALYADAVGGFNFLGSELFHLALSFPANVPTGNYTVQIFLVRDKRVVGGQTSPLYISQAGLDAEVNDFAQRRALIYGVMAVVGAALAGWLSSLPFRHA
ncbi:MAG: TIGR02186 family protein [Stellaceae bacterium]